MQDEIIVYDRLELDRLLVNIEASVKVHKRSDFFSWVQGILQALIAHEVLLCGLPDPGQPGLRFDWVGSFPVGRSGLQDLHRSDGGLLHGLQAAWERAERVPVTVTKEPSTTNLGRGRHPLARELYRLELDNALVHGLPGIDGRPAAFFVFCNLPPVDLPRAARMLELLLPCLHAAWLRANCGSAGPDDAQLSESNNKLTTREREVLNWVERGKSNGEIGQILGISPLTVKNHVQKILRKLDVRNRAQAVAKTIALMCDHASND
jgi:transcriptional regulator EpsA